MLDSASCLVADFPRGPAACRVMLESSMPCPVESTSNLVSLMMCPFTCSQKAAGEVDREIFSFPARPFDSSFATFLFLYSFARHDLSSLVGS